MSTVVVAALKEAFEQDRARLELERAHFEEQRRRSEENVRIELLRQMADREIGRLRFSRADCGVRAFPLLVGGTVFTAQASLPNGRQ